MPTRAVRNGGRSFHFLSPYTKILRLSAERKLREQFRTMVRAPVLSLPLFIYILRSCLIPQFLGHTRAGRYIRSWDVVGKSLEAARRTRDSRFCEFHNQRSFQVVPCSTVPCDDVSLLSFVPPYPPFREVTIGPPIRYFVFGAKIDLFLYLFPFFQHHPPT